MAYLRLFLTASSAVAALAAQNPSGVKAIQVTIPVTVTDSLDRVIPGLAGEAFHLFEKDIEQSASLTAPDIPACVGFIVDTSSSMANSGDAAIPAVTDFFHSLGPGLLNDTFLIEFGDRPSLIQGLTSDTDVILNHLKSSAIHGKTALLDGIYLGLNELEKSTSSRRVLLVISDGHDTGSHYTDSEVLRRAMESQVQIFAIRFINPTEERTDENTDVAFLHSLADPTGGQVFEGRGGESMEIAARLATGLTNQYLVRWTSTNTLRDGGFRKINVRLSPDEKTRSLQVKSPAGYYAPAH